MTRSPAQSESGLPDRPPQDASTDSLIRWLGRAREQAPRQPLQRLLGTSSPNPEVLFELVVVDLIRSWRSGNGQTVENYLRQFPKLAVSDGWLLDLIDAELCVRRETGHPPELEALAHRFPKLKQEIRQLYFLDDPPAVQLEGGSPPSPAWEASSDADPSVFLQQGSVFLKQGRGSRQAVTDPEATSSLLPCSPGPAASSGAPEDAHKLEHDDSIDVKIPINPPPWMTGVRCIGSQWNAGGREWLVKGRDADQGESVAMKILPLPEGTDRNRRTRILDLCELASGVGHPAWVSPRIAAINNDHLAVIRPWIFGVSFDAESAGKSPSVRLRSLIRIGYALAAAHRIGASHGSVHRRNVILDHENEARLVDACSTRSAWDFSLAHWKDDLGASATDRIRHDTLGFLSLIADEFLQSQEPSRLSLLGQWAETVREQPEDACAVIAEHLQSTLDGKSRGKRWWSR